MRVVSKLHFAVVSLLFPGRKNRWGEGNRKVACKHRARESRRHVDGTPDVHRSRSDTARTGGGAASGRRRDDQFVRG